eukprot:scaffold104274_cov73-Phaeocystis_antarctica.AAC.1
MPSFVPQRRHVLAARWNAPELCRTQQLVRPAEDVQGGHCDQLGHLEVHACGKTLPWRAAKVDEELERRRAHRHCGRDERAIGDAADAADRSVLLDPPFHVSHALAYCSGAACLVHRCRLPAKVAGAVVLSRCSEACEQLGCWAHGMRRVEELYLKAVSSELGQPAGELKYPAHQRAVPCLAVQHEQPPGGRVDQAAGSRAQLCAVVACHLLGRQRPEFELSDDIFHRTSSTPSASDNWSRNCTICIEVRPSDSYLVLGSTVEPVTSVRIRQAFSTAEPPSAVVQGGWRDAASSLSAISFAASRDAVSSLEGLRVRAIAAIRLAASISCIASASTAPPAVRATSASTVSSDAGVAASTLTARPIMSPDWLRLDSVAPPPVSLAIASMTSMSRPYQSPVHSFR